MQLGEASSRLPEDLVQLLSVGGESHGQTSIIVSQPQPLLFVATQRLQDTVQMTKKY